MRFFPSFFFCCNEPICPSLKKKWKLWRLPKIKGSILKYKVLPLLPTYIGERRTTFAKPHEIKMRCYWELFALTPPQTCMESPLSTIQLESEEWTVIPHQTQFQKIIFVTPLTKNHFHANEDTYGNHFGPIT